MDALDLDVFKIRPVRRLITKPVGQVVELESHLVLEVLLEHHATNLFRHFLLLLNALGGHDIHACPTALQNAESGSREDRWSKRLPLKSISCAQVSSNIGIPPSPKCRPPNGSDCSISTPISAKCGSPSWTRPESSVPCWVSPAPACRPRRMLRPRSATPNPATTFWPRKSRSVPTAIPALRICRCRTPRPQPTNWSAASKS